MTTERPRRRRPPHAALAGRVLTAGLAAGTAVGLVGVLAQADAAATTAEPPATTLDVPAGYTPFHAVGVIGSSSLSLGATTPPVAPATTAPPATAAPATSGSPSGGTSPAAAPVPATGAAAPPASSAAPTAATPAPAATAPPVTAPPVTAAPVTAPPVTAPPVTAPPATTTGGS